jgi:hypothetical protein
VAEQAVEGDVVLADGADAEGQAVVVERRLVQAIALAHRLPVVAGVALFPDEPEVVDADARHRARDEGVDGEQLVAVRRLLRVVVVQHRQPGGRRRAEVGPASGHRQQQDQACALHKWS